MGFNKGYAVRVSVKGVWGRGGGMGTLLMGKKSAQSI